MAQQAQDTFVAVLDDGTERLVTRGEVLPDSHELVKRDTGGLFRPLNVDGGEVTAIKPRARPAPEPAPKAEPAPAAKAAPVPAPKAEPKTVAKGKA